MAQEKLKVFVNTKDNLDYVRLCGVIDEDNNLLGVLPRLTRDVVVVGLLEPAAPLFLGQFDGFGLGDGHRCLLLFAQALIAARPPR